MPEFMVLALITGVIVPLMTGPLGCFVVWRKMAYFGDALAHAALNGVAIGLILSVNVTAAVAVSSVFMALLLFNLEKQPLVSTDTLLGILSHTMLAVGLITISLFNDGRVDLYSYLFGDILAVTRGDIVVIASAATVICSLCIRYWQPLLSQTVDRELSEIEGVASSWHHILLMLMIALLVAVGMKIVGVLLITALIIIPAAAARFFSHSPETMVVTATLIGMIAITSGVTASYMADVPAGPASVLTTSLFFAIGLVIQKTRTLKRRQLSSD